MGNIMKCGMHRHNITSNFFHSCGCNLTVSCMQSIAMQETARLAIHFLNEQNVAANAATEVRQHEF